jgi:hypothetical protein
MNWRKTVTITRTDASAILVAVGLLPLAIREGDLLIIGLAALIPFFAHRWKEYHE